MANLSRAYRPSVFAQVTGQDNIKETLRKEVEQKKLGHAYLFSGPRGIGKTTIARIFAKAVNCLEPKAGEPCLKCQACERVAAGSIDVIEMDAASHTGVDNVRESIVEHVRFVPAELRYKVYIIDEAHMLSTSAWNALLKTIEEPPEHAIFIFATTEKHKVPATIVSRCQRFDFRRIPDENILVRLKELAANEKFKVDEQVYLSITARAEGCLRDAENLLGQLFSLGEKNVTSEVATLVIPASQLPLAQELLAIAARRDVSGVLKKIQDLEQDGVAFMPLFDDLIATVRGLMLSNKPEIEGFSPKELLNISLLLMERRKDIKQGLDPRFALELAMLAIATGATGDDGKGQTTEKRNFTEQKPTEPQTPDVIAPRPTTPVPLTNKTSTTPAMTSLADMHALWPKLLGALENNKSLLFILKLSRPDSIDGHCLNISFQYPYHQQTILQNFKNKMLIEKTLRELSGDEEMMIQGLVKAAEAEEAKPLVPKDTISSLINAFGGQVMP